MNVQLVTVLFVIFVSRMEAVPDEDGNSILPKQIDTCDTFPQIKCSSDCSSYLVCHDETSNPWNLKCPNNKPYCLNGKCGTVKGNCRINTYANVLSTFTCTSDGTFPDPTDCTKSYVCNGGIATQVSCPPGLIFNSKFRRCERGVSRVDHASKKICQKISCDQKPNDYISFPANPAFYAECRNVNGMQTMTMYKCDDVQNQVFDVKLGMCIFNCKSAGFFPDPLDCTAYYQCSGWIKFKFTRVVCPAGQFFYETGCTDDMGNCENPPVDPTITTPTTSNPTPPTYTTPTSTTDPEMPPITVLYEGSTINSGNSLIFDQLFGPTTKPTRKPSTFPFYSLWKHKGKYSIRLAKFL